MTSSQPTSSLLATDASSTQASPPENTLENTSKSTPEGAALSLAKQLAYDLTITSGDWHRLKSNRRARALEQVSVALVYLLNHQTDEALDRLHQATGWLDRTISAPPCPTHGHQKTSAEE
jgi:Family of unknown function (DUF6439)